jgi:signal peptidase I
VSGTLPPEPDSPPMPDPQEPLVASRPVTGTRGALEEGLLQLAAGVRAEREGLRRDVDGIRGRLDEARLRYHDPERFAVVVRGLLDRDRREDAATVPAEAPPAEPVAPPPEAPAPEAPPPELRAPEAPAPEAPAPEAPAPEAPPEPPERARPGRLRRWVGRLGAVLVAAAVVIVLLVAVGPKVLPYEVFFVRSGSMAPTFEEGDMIVLTRVDAAEIAEGDVVSFERPDRPGVLITHRVVAVEVDEAGRLLRTKGDANPSVDAWSVPAVGSMWRYRFDVPRVGHVFRFLATTPARVALLVVPVVVLAILAVVDRRRR